MSADYDIGMLTLCGNAIWQNAGWPRRFAAVLFGRHEVFTHLGKRLRISFYDGKPYLLTIREVV